MKDENNEESVPAQTSETATEVTTEVQLETASEQVEVNTEALNITVVDVEYDANAPIQEIPVLGVFTGEPEMTEDEQIDDLFDRSEHPPKESSDEAPAEEVVAETDDQRLSREQAEGRAKRADELTAKVREAIVNIRGNTTLVGITTLRTVIRRVLGEKPNVVSLDKSGSISIETADGLKLKV